MEFSKKTAWQYVIGTFLLSYMSWWSIIIANSFGYLKFGTPLAMILYLLGGFAPTIAACVVLIRNHEVPGFMKIVKDTFRLRQSLSVYGMVLFFLALSYLFPVIFGKVTVTAPFYIAIFMIPAMIFGGGLEEVGWRYILQPVLERKYPFMIACAIVGVIWACWHFPLFLIAGTNQNLYMNFLFFH